MNLFGYNPVISTIIPFFRNLIREVILENIWSRSYLDYYFIKMNKEPLQFPVRVLCSFLSTFLKLSPLIRPDTHGFW